MPAAGRSTVDSASSAWSTAGILSPDDLDHGGDAEQDQRAVAGATNWNDGAELDDAPAGEAAQQQQRQPGADAGAGGQADAERQRRHDLQPRPRVHDSSVRAGAPGACQARAGRGPAARPAATFDAGRSPTSFIFLRGEPAELHAPAVLPDLHEGRACPSLQLDRGARPSRGPARPARRRCRRSSGRRRAGGAGRGAATGTSIFSTMRPGRASGGGTVHAGGRLQRDVGRAERERVHDRLRDLVRILVGVDVGGDRLLVQADLEAQGRVEPGGVLRVPGLPERAAHARPGSAARSGSGRGARRAVQHLLAAVGLLDLPDAVARDVQPAVGRLQDVAACGPAVATLPLMRSPFVRYTTSAPAVSGQRQRERQPPGRADATSHEEPPSLRCRRASAGGPPDSGGRLRRDVAQLGSSRRALPRARGSGSSTRRKALSGAALEAAAPCRASPARSGPPGARLVAHDRLQHLLRLVQPVRVLDVGAGQDHARPLRCGAAEGARPAPGAGWRPSTSPPP